MLKPYNDYKNIKCDWMDTIPVHWDAQKIRELFTERKEKVSDKDYAPLSVSRGGIVPQISTVAKSNDGDNRKLVRNGDFAINSRSDRRGSSGLSVYDGSVSLINIVLCPRSSLNGRYTHYLLKSHSFIEEYYRNGRGIVADLWTTRYAEMKSIVLPLPPLEEQNQIVRYLDWQVSKTNKLIHALKKQIALLKEQKQTVINEAVTKGLDPSVQMKDSGVEWVGKIPETWIISRVKHYARVNGRIGFKGYTANDTVDETTPGRAIVLGGTNIMRDGFISYDKVTYLSEHKYYESPEIMLYGGEIIMTKVGAGCGESGIYYHKEDRVTINPNVMIVLPKKISCGMLHYAFLSDYVRTFLKLESAKSGAQPAINQSHVKNLLIVFPAIESEQVDIVEYLNVQCRKIDSLINNINNKITILGEYRTRLISDVVTGQVDVRDIEVPEFEYITDEAEDVSDDESIDTEETVDEEA